MSKLQRSAWITLPLTALLLLGSGTVALYLLIGLVYGITCWLLARSGFLPFPEGRVATC